ncbi:hypothetical protein J3E72DRAFT_380845 [Bipolaris maydis]|nr:hypothetical protein J3E72DRAFT_380845 [Bipolaris maydis]
MTTVNSSMLSMSSALSESEDCSRGKDFRRLLSAEINLLAKARFLRLSLVYALRRRAAHAQALLPNFAKPKFFDHVLEVEIMGPKLVPLTLANLPGVIHYSNAPSGSRDIELINDVVGKYIAEPNSVILAVVSTHNDLNLQATLTRIQKIHGATDRTLGIITKPDELPQGSEKEQECIEYAHSNTAKFKYGWQVVRN